MSADVGERLLADVNHKAVKEVLARYETHAAPPTTASSGRPPPEQAGVPCHACTLTAAQRFRQIACIVAYQETQVADACSDCQGE